jgi:hypothetical protein
VLAQNVFRASPIRTLQVILSLCAERFCCRCRAANFSTRPAFSRPAGALLPLRLSGWLLARLPLQRKSRFVAIVKDGKSAICVIFILPSFDFLICSFDHGLYQVIWQTHLS